MILVVCLLLAGLAGLPVSKEGSGTKEVAQLETGTRATLYVGLKLKTIVKNYPRETFGGRAPKSFSISLYLPKYIDKIVKLLTIPKVFKQ